LKYKVLLQTESSIYIFKTMLRIAQIAVGNPKIALAGAQ